MKNIHSLKNYSSKRGRIVGLLGLVRHDHADQHLAVSVSGLLEQSPGLTLHVSLPLPSRP